MKKKVVAWMMAAGLMVSLFSGCSASVDTKVDLGDKSETSDEASTDTKDAKEAADAEDEETEEEDIGEFTTKSEDGALDLSKIGVNITLPSSFEGHEIGCDGVILENNAFAILYLIDEDDEENKNMQFFEIMGSDSGSTIKEISKEAGYEDIPEEAFVDLGENNAFHYIGLRYDLYKEKKPEDIEEFIYEFTPDDKRDEYDELLSHSQELVDGIELLDFEVADSLTGEKVTESKNTVYMDATLEDLDRNASKLGDIISENKITMLNVWGTFCGPCIEEMPALAEIEKEYKDKGFEIVGLTGDIVMDGVVDESLVADAKSIVADTGVEYPVFIMSQDMIDALDLEFFPTTIFVDSQGNTLKAVTGSKNKDDWMKMIDELLAEAE